VGLDGRGSEDEGGVAFGLVCPFDGGTSSAASRPLLVDLAEVYASSGTLEYEVGLTLFLFRWLIRFSIIWRVLEFYLFRAGGVVLNVVFLEKPCYLPVSRKLAAGRASHIVDAADTNVSVHAQVDLRRSLFAEFGGVVVIWDSLTRLEGGVRERVRVRVRPQIRYAET
jgi:hypothetical protein